MPSSRVARTLALSIAAASLAAVPAAAATKNGITPLGPKVGASVPSGKGLTFRMRVSDPGSGVFVNICKSRKKGKEGVICMKGSGVTAESTGESFLGPAKKRGSAFVAKQKFFDFPDFWLNNPGRYYWQAFRIECKGGSSDCKQEGPVVRFKVR